VEEEAVSVQTVIGHLLANAETAKKALARVIPEIPREANWPEHHALDRAIITDRKLWPATTIKKLGPIIERFL
jgi:5'-methylthioadenosine phosphorylase